MLTAHFVALAFICTVSFSLGSADKLIVPQCDRYMFDSTVNNCLSVFNHSMESSGYRDECPWPTVKRSYNELKYCVDHCATASWCMGRGFLVDAVFLEIHKTYFTLCGQVQDPSLVSLVMLIAPGIIVTLFLPLVCVHLNTWDM